MNDALTSRLGRLNGVVAKSLARIAAVILALVAAVTFFDVFARYVFNKPFTFTVEATEFGMALIVFLGVGLVTHNNGHITVDVLTLRLSNRIRALLGLVINILALAYLAILVWRLWLQAFFLLSKGDKTQIWAIPLWPVAFVMAAGSIFLLTGTILYLANTWLSATGWHAPPTAEPAARPFSE
jgi:TRAP-type C4-dicarboxylate transport system permease small subunit